MSLTKRIPILRATKGNDHRKAVIKSKSNLSEWALPMNWHPKGYPSSVLKTGAPSVGSPSSEPSEVGAGSPLSRRPIGAGPTADGKAIRSNARKMGVKRSPI